MLINHDLVQKFYYAKYLAQKKKEEQVTPGILARSELLRVQKESKLFDLKTYNRIPRFDSDELVLGPLLANGTFSDVFEIDSIKIKRSIHNNEIHDVNNETKQFIATHCRREENGDARYAIKYLKKEVTKRPAVFKQCAVDLIHEAAMLSSICHPNIIKIRGIALNGAKGFDMQPVGGFFLLLDRLYDTLQERMDQWKESKEKSKRSITADIFSKSVITNLKMNRKGQREFLRSRLTVAYHLAHAMHYLHQNRIVYRDLKPENIGFDVRGDLKLFDFGAAYEFPEDLDLNLEHPSPGAVGTPRYMAPEVAMNKPYNLMADVYSFGILLWEIIELKTPYEIYLTNPFFRADVIEGGKRPPISLSLPKRLRKLLQKCWSEKISDRIPFGLIIQTLKDAITDLKCENDQGLNKLYDERMPLIGSLSMPNHAVANSAKMA